MSKIIDLDDLNNYLTDMADAARGQLIVDGINSYIEGHTGRCFGETKQVTEMHDAKRVVWLDHPNIVSIDAVMLGRPGQTPQTAAATAYYFNPLGRLTFYSNWFSHYRQLADYLNVQYTYGFTALGNDEDSNPVVPDDLRMAALGIAGSMYNWASNGNRDIASTSVGSYRVEYTNKRASGGANDPATTTADQNWAIIEKYRVRHQ